MEWMNIALMIGGAAIGGFLGVKVAVTRLETQMAYVLEEIQSLREDRHRHANMIQDHEARLSFLERDD